MRNDGWPSGEDSGYNYDRNFYHTEIDFNITKEAAKAYYINFSGYDVWIPKKICRKSRNEGKMFVHTSIFNKILEEKL